MASAAKEEIPEVIAAEMAADRAQRREERQSLVAIPAADLATAAQRTTFMPQSMGEAMQFAGLMARSNFVPMHLRGKEGDCMAIVMQAARWGMDPFAVGNKSYFVKDGAPPAYESQLVNAVVNSSGALSGRLRIAFDGEGEKLRCTVTGFLRADPNDEKVKTQSIARITTRNSPLWKADPQQQLAYYTTRAWARLWCPEVLLGVYTPEELDVDPERARVVSAPMPRRDPMSISEPAHNPDTGEIDPRSEQEIAEQLDRETEEQREGRTDEQHGDQHNDTDAPYQDMVDGLIGRVVKASIMGDIISAVAEFDEHREALPENVTKLFDGKVAAAQKAFAK